MKGSGHSSTIRGWLEAGGHRFVLAQVGPDHCIVRSSVATPPMEAELVIEIDGDERRNQVSLLRSYSIDWATLNGRSRAVNCLASALGLTG